MESFTEIKCKFLCQYPLKHMRFMIEKTVEDSLEIQDVLISMTVLSAICRKFPPSTEYQTKFLKIVIEKLEREGMEVSDILYETYTTLLTRGKADNCQRHKSFRLPIEERYITIQESEQMISHGTTGLQVWPAAICLAEWALENTSEFHQKTSLELGCGLGFTGIVISKTCSPSSYTFTDCHFRVLEKLKENLRINDIFAELVSKQEGEEHGIPIENKTLSNTDVGKKNSAESLDKSNFHSVISEDKQLCQEVDTKQLRNELGSLKLKKEMIGTQQGEASLKTNLKLKSNVRDHLDDKTKVSVCLVDWEEFQQEELHGLCADVVLASDVIFDPRIIDPLVNVLSCLLHKQTSLHQPVAYIASTVRNESTYNKFLQSLDSSRIQWSDIPPPKHQVFYYDRNCPIRIIKLQANVR